MYKCIEKGYISKPRMSVFNVYTLVHTLAEEISLLFYYFILSVRFVLYINEDSGYWIHITYTRGLREKLYFYLFVLLYI